MSRYTPKRARLKMVWGKIDKHTDPDLIASNGPGTSKADRNLLLSVVCMPRWCGRDPQPSFMDELAARGYDLTTLRFSIDKKDPQT